MGIIRYIKWTRKINNKVRLANIGNEEIDQYNLIDNNGKFLSPISFDNCYSLGHSGEFMCVKLNGKENIIDLNGKLLSPIWFDNVNNYVDFNDNCGYGMVELDNKLNFIDKQGNLISDKWFDKVMRFNNNGYTAVILKDQCYKLDVNGTLTEIPNYYKNHFF